MTTAPGIAPILWTFSVWGEKVAHEVPARLGKRTWCAI